MRDDRARLQDILEAVELIEKYAAQGRAKFEEDELIQTWIVHHMLLLGEAASGLSPDFRHRHTEKIWKEAIGRRNILIHQYFEIALDLVWRVVEQDLPVLKKTVQDILVKQQDL